MASSSLRSNISSTCECVGMKNVALKCEYFTESIREVTTQRKVIVSVTLTFQNIYCIITFYLHYEKCLSSSFTSYYVIQDYQNVFLGPFHSLSLQNTHTLPIRLVNFKYIGQLKSL